MKLPGVEDAAVPRAKIADYLLSTAHVVGRHKAAYFLSRGFTAENWERLSDSLIEHARIHEVTEEVRCEHGIVYVVEGTLTTPDGSDAYVRGVWIIEQGLGFPRFVTAYPIPR